MHVANLLKRPSSRVVLLRRCSRGLDDLVGPNKGDLSTAGDRAPLGGPQGHTSEPFGRPAFALSPRRLRSPPPPPRGRVVRAAPRRAGEEPHPELWWSRSPRADRASSSRGSDVDHLPLGATGMGHRRGWQPWRVALGTRIAGQRLRRHSKVSPAAFLVATAGPCTVSPDAKSSSQRVVSSDSVPSSSRLQRHPIQTRCLLVGEQPGGSVAGASRVVDRTIYIAAGHRLKEVMRELGQVRLEILCVERRSISPTRRCGRRRRATAGRSS